ncbi:nuclear transport factor 2 family protein [Streptomyces sp. NPDC005227]|uniref:nuclear transport factor 2 family protein n=1 Tax=Streptomyces sp. NPDC005227 TaxID=3364707 RepID=UPI0036A803C0
MAYEPAQETDVRETVGKFFRLLGEGDVGGVADVFTEEIDWYVPGDEKVLAWVGRRTRRDEVPGYFMALGSAFDPAQGGTNIDKILVDGADAVALCTFSLVVRSNGRRFSMPVAFHFTVESGRLVRLHLYEDTELVARNVTASG